MANLSFLAGLLWGMHDIKKQQEQEEVSYKNVDIDHLLNYAAKAKIAQTPEKYITESEKNEVLKRMEDVGVDSRAIETIENMIDHVVMKRFAIMFLVDEMVKCNEKLNSFAAK